MHSSDGGAAYVTTLSVLTEQAAVASWALALRTILEIVTGGPILAGVGGACLGPVLRHAATGAAGGTAAVHAVVSGGAAVGVGCSRTGASSRCVAAGLLAGAALQASSSCACADVKR